MLIINAPVEGIKHSLEKYFELHHWGMFSNDSFATFVKKSIAEKHNYAIVLFHQQNAKNAVQELWSFFKYGLPLLASNMQQTGGSIIVHLSWQQREQSKDDFAAVVGLVRSTAIEGVKLGINLNLMSTDTSQNLSQETTAELAQLVIEWANPAQRYITSAIEIL